MEPIYIYPGNCTVFGDCTKWLTFHLETDLDLTGWTAEFKLFSITRKITDITSKSFDVILSYKETKELLPGKALGSITLTDNRGNVKTIVNNIPFEITYKVIENEYQEIDLTVPESSGVDIKLKVGSIAVTSVNGMTGDVYLDIPSIEGLATEQQLVQGLNTKQDKGDYATNSRVDEVKLSIPDVSGLATKEEIPDVSGLATKEEIPDLTDYVKDTDYATSLQGGVIKQSSTYGSGITNGILYASTKSLEDYNKAIEKIFISKGTLENIKDDYVKRGLTENATELTADEKANAKAWLGYAEPTDIMQAIASIPQFNLSIVNELPETGAKMTLYLVPKEGTDNDVYDEYIWIEQTSSFEHLGTTAVNLTEYVKKTDYATTDVGGVVKQYRPNSFTSASGLPICTTQTLDYYNSRTDGNMFIGRGTLENIKNDLVKRAVTENDIELTDDEKASARTWLGAISATDYAGATTGGAGVVKCSSTFACGCTNGYIQAMNIPTLERYNNLSQYAFIGKATLQTALTEYSKTVLTTEADYNALETKDANTLYLIEE